MTTADTPSAALAADGEMRHVRELPSPADLAARLRTDAAREQERARVKVVRQRRRARRGARLRSHVSEGTLAALAQVARPGSEEGVSDE